MILQIDLFYPVLLRALWSPILIFIILYNVIVPSPPPGSIVTPNGTASIRESHQMPRRTPSHAFLFRPNPACLSIAQCYRPSSASTPSPLRAALCSASVCCIFCILSFGSIIPICLFALAKKYYSHFLPYSSLVPIHLFPSPLSRAPRISFTCPHLRPSPILIPQKRSKTYHAQQPPHRLARLRSYSQPVFRPRHVQLYVFERFALAVWRGFRDRVVGAEDFEGFGVAGSSEGRARRC